ncbi:MAG: WbqC family protein [Desulfomicrobium sp.]|nr:WbqC family protein [Desulfomicrobium sp.]
MKLAIMQPYFFPYIGYFQLVNAVDKFIFYDDVQYIKGGWINRNRILINGEARYFTTPLIKSSQNKLINEIAIETQSVNFSKAIKTIAMAYQQAPQFEVVFEIICDVLKNRDCSIGDMAAESIKQCAHYLGINTKFYKSSQYFSETKKLKKAERLQSICKQMDANIYINPIGGQNLYSKENFEENGIELKFIRSLPIEYTQFNNEFVPWLSIIDVLMFNSIKQVKKMLNRHEYV